MYQHHQQHADFYNIADDGLLKLLTEKNLLVFTVE